MEVAAEFEPFMKNGFKLLRRTKDANSIKQMWKYFDEAIEEQYGSNRRPTNAAKRIPVPTALMTKDLGNEQFDVGAEDESSSSSSSSSPAPSTSKNIVEVCSSPPPTITLEQAKADPVINIDSDSDMETDLEAYSCFVCKESFVHMGNSLVECLDCHSMYHQNCHSPPITDINLNDPRIVWYCSNCRQRDSQKADTRTSGKDGNKKSSSKSTSAKIEKSSTKSSQHAKASPSKSKSSSDNSSPKHFPPTSSTISAMEKRVQMMKKKAAKKSEKKK
ncbi:integrator complex subunit 12 isoform X2 [Daktulosphaira vitifoliae]|uniref:integrator complex subunit 12 isoform X2 n=1 Tax=Daktulosphaira vitifoliae TaxID=58002 RepID=UPI0021AA64C0|nr:integrator complex subunit 12 isoform X2 [Daktulosphaira vitifoliae]